MITLKEAFKICDVTNDDMVYLRNNGNLIHLSEYKFLTGKKVRDTYDMRKTLVSNITPLFSFGDYLGLLFTIKE